ncbi:MAG: type II/IV secretion system protein [Desulfuromonadales bacterium]|nr:type II/IV secretion system protein [Desulfuromonadales bacterium]NIR34104.1 type II/IV secretion system protein [Desulfuromonadales bacterium]NIS41560.1 type II/IV secretion system protein [Desulfuromonadales bacterium]
MTKDREERQDDEKPQSRPVYEDKVRALRAAIEDRDEGLGTEEPVETLSLLRDAWRENASDIHLDPQVDGYRLRLRLDGILIDVLELDVDRGLRLLNQFKTLSRVSPGAVLTAEEGRFSVTLDEGQAPIDLRLALVPCIIGEKLAVRMLVRRKVERQIQQLGLAEEEFTTISSWLNNLKGMFLAAGPTGCGKTTTLYALLHQLKLMERNIMTVEDPVEYSIPGINQVQVNQEQGLDFAAGAKALLRLDPDFLLVGEIRDRSSARAALNAATSGRIMLSTLHSHDAAGVIGALRNYGMSDLEIAPNLAMVVSQRLVRILCPECREEKELREQDREWFEDMGITPPDRVWYPRGCEECANVGYHGRTGVFEVWRLRDEDYRLILDSADEHSIRSSLRQRGHRSLIDNASEKMASGEISPSEIRALSGFGPLGEPLTDWSPSR